MTRSEWKKANKKLYNDIDKKGRYTNNTPKEGVYEFEDPAGNAYRFALFKKDDNYFLDIRGTNGTDKTVTLTLD